MVKMSVIDMPAADSISVSASAKGSESRIARRRPIEDFPAPIMPTRTTERPCRPSIIAAPAVPETGIGGPFGCEVAGCVMAHSRGADGRGSLEHFAGEGNAARLKPACPSGAARRGNETLPCRNRKTHGLCAKVG
jgi:hypothetical protein